MSWPDVIADMVDAGVPPGAVGEALAILQGGGELLDAMEVIGAALLQMEKIEQAGYYEAEAIVVQAERAMQAEAARR